MEQKKHSEINNPFIIVSLTDNNPSSSNWRRGFSITLTVILIFLGLCISNILLTILCYMAIPFVWTSYFKHTHKPKSKDDILQSNLKWFIRQHNLYKEDIAEVAIKENGTEKVKKEKYISYSAKFGVKNDPENIVIRAYKTGDCYTSKMNTFDTDLSALLNLPLSDKRDNVSWCDYIFKKQSDMYYKSATEFYIIPPKTKAGNRTIALDDKTIKYLKDWQAVQKKNLLECKWVLSYNGVPTNKYAPMDIITKHSKMAGVHRIRTHALRHSHASMLISMGISALVVRDRLGHEDIKVTLETYGHLYPNTDFEVANQITNLLNTPEDENKVSSLSAEKNKIKAE